MMPKTLSIVLSITIVLAGCGSSSQQRGSIADVVGATALGLEVAETTQDQARNEVLSTPTEFDLTIEQDTYSWERARFFLENYVQAAQAPAIPVTKVVGSRWALSSPPTSSGHYVYEVWREAIPDGFHYSVKCLASSDTADQSQALLNSANLARFVRDGKLEVSLLPVDTGR